MAFYGCEFVFDNIPCTEYGLMIYDFGSNTQSDTVFPSGEILEDRIASRYDSFMYGVTQNGSLEYTLVFGANNLAIDDNDHIDRYEVEAIAAWLTGHNTRKWLTIIQDDMDVFRYNCTISELRLITHGNMPWAFSCKVICDSPFAYMTPETYQYSINGTEQIRLVNRSTYNGYYKPKIELTITDGNGFSIINATDGNRVFSFDFSRLNVNKPITIIIDNLNQMITSTTHPTINLYEYFNMRFFRMLRGDNVLTINGVGEIKFLCEFPVSIGG